MLLGLVVAGAFLLVRNEPIVGLATIAGALAAYGAVAMVAYVDSGLILDMFEPALAIVLMWVGSVLFRYFVVERQRQKVRSTFSRFVSREVVISFCDICGFMPLSESMSPGEVVELRNEYFTEMTDIVFRYEGTVNKYIGDAIMAFYGAPVPLPNPSERSVRARLEMREALSSLNLRRVAQGKRGFSEHNAEPVLPEYSSLRGGSTE